MADVNTLIRRIDQELRGDVEREKAVRMDIMRTARERSQRLPRYEAAANHVIELLKPRLDAFLDRFKAVVKAEPQVREHTRAMKMEFAATVAKVKLTFAVFPDVDVTQVRLQCTQDIVPVLVRYDKESVLEQQLDAVKDDAVVQWFDERIVAFVKAYIALVHQDAVLKEHLQEQFVEDPVVKVRFPKYLAASTVERDGQTYYFLDDDTRQEFDKQPATKK
jgi:YHS domain-containing protein